MTKLLIKSAQVVNEGQIKTLDVLIDNERISKIDPSISLKNESVKEINAEGLFLLPGLIDDQVHFREPGFTTKGTIYSESKAAVAGGITSFMEMPNTWPNTTDLNVLEEKYELAQQSSLANFSFFMGINKHNLEEALKIDNGNVCGLSDDGLYFDDEEGILANYPDYLEKLFSRTNSLVALHCEDDKIINQNLKRFKKQYGEDIPIWCHPFIRSELACYEATARVIQLAEKNKARLHVLHVSTAKETTLFEKVKDIREKRITGEACVHHLWFSNNDSVRLGSKIKWNPAIKTEDDKNGLLKALLDDRLDIIATDHAPHLLWEKETNYGQSKSGGPLVQHALPILLELYHQNKIGLEKIVEKTSHHVAEIYRLKDRGYIREGYYADLTLVNINEAWTATNENTLYKCGWSPFESCTFKSKIKATIVNGDIIFDNGSFNEQKKGKRLLFEKDR
jgi:dihydroorotase